MIRRRSVFAILTCACHFVGGASNVATLSRDQLLIKYENLSSHYEKLSSRHAFDRRNRKCSDLYRSYLPFTEDNYIISANFDPGFIGENHLFASIMISFDENKNRPDWVDNYILRPFGLEMLDSSTCSFTLKNDTTTPSTTTSPSPKSTKSGKQIKSTPANPSPGKCEKFLVFFYALRRCPKDEIKHPDLIAWKNFVEMWEHQAKMPYPFLVQRILTNMFWANRFHHGVIDEKEALDNSKTTPDGQFVDIYYECLIRFPGVSLAYDTPDTWERPSVQYYSDMTPPLTPSTAASASKPTVMSRDEFAALMKSLAPFELPKTPTTSSSPEKVVDQNKKEDGEG